MGAPLNRRQKSMMKTCSPFRGGVTKKTLCSTRITELQLRQTRGPFIGHVATDEGLKPDQAKVKAIADMTAPANVA